MICLSHLFDQHQDYICHKCQRKAESIEELQKKIDAEKKEITTLIGRHFTGTKRTRDESECSSHETPSTEDSLTPTRSVDRRSTRDKDVPVLVSCMLTANSNHASNTFYSIM